jgi:hypothetical protein
MKRKMNTDLKQGVDLVLKLRDLVKGHHGVAYRSPSSHSP